MSVVVIGMKGEKNSNSSDTSEDRRRVILNIYVRHLNRSHPWRR